MKQKKLILNKITIANLSIADMIKVQAGEMPNSRPGDTTCRHNTTCDCETSTTLGPECD